MQIKQSFKNIFRISHWRQRLSVRRMVLEITGLLAGLQAITVIILQIVSAQRKHHRQEDGFPHPYLDEVRVGDNTLQIYDYGRDLYDAMLAAIDGAQESIYLETYIWKGDAVGQVFKEHLERKAAQGVDVYVIFDRFGNTVVPHDFKVFPPSIHALPYQAIRRPWHLIDLRRYALDHRKLLVVDGYISFIGGYNLGSLYATSWRDTHLRIQGPTAADLAQTFIDFWNREFPVHTRITRHYPRRFDPLINLRGTAAARRGVDVQVLVPWISNHIVVDWLTRGYFTECLKTGIRVFAYRHMLHAKTCTIDGQWSTIGTANLDRLSSVGNYEINAEIYSEALAQQMEELFTCDTSNALELMQDQWMRRPWYSKLGEHILSPLRIFL